MSACLQGYFHEEFVSTPKILLLIGNIKLLHYVPCFFFLSVCMHGCVVFMGLSIPTNTVSLFLTLENQCHLGIYKDKLMARLYSRWKRLANFCIHWTDLPQMYLTRDFSQSLFLDTGKWSFPWDISFSWPDGSRWSVPPAVGGLSRGQQNRWAWVTACGMWCPAGANGNWHCPALIQGVEDRGWPQQEHLQDAFPFWRSVGLSDEKVLISLMVKRGS